MAVLAAAQGNRIAAQVRVVVLDTAGTAVGSIGQRERIFQDVRNTIIVGIIAPDRVNSRCIGSDFDARNRGGGRVVLAVNLRVLRCGPADEHNRNVFPIHSLVGTRGLVGSIQRIVAYRQVIDRAGAARTAVGVVDECAHRVLRLGVTACHVELHIQALRIIGAGRPLGPIPGQRHRLRALASNHLMVQTSAQHIAEAIRIAGRHRDRHGIHAFVLNNRTNLESAADQRAIDRVMAFTTGQLSSDQLRHLRVTRAIRRIKVTCHIECDAGCHRSLPLLGGLIPGQRKGLGVCLAGSQVMGLIKISAVPLNIARTGNSHNAFIFAAGAVLGNSANAVSASRQIIGLGVCLMGHIRVGAVHLDRIRQAIQITTGRLVGADGNSGIADGAFGKLDLLILLRAVKHQGNIGIGMHLTRGRIIVLQFDFERNCLLLGAERNSLLLGADGADFPGQGATILTGSKALLQRLVRYQLKGFGVDHVGHHGVFAGMDGRGDRLTQLRQNSRQSISASTVIILFGRARFGGGDVSQRLLHFISADINSDRHNGDATFN